MRCAMKVVEMKGKRFGYLVVLERVENNKKGQAVWLCECDCGNKKKYLGINLRFKHPLSCGCDLRKKTKAWGKVGGVRPNSGRKKVELKKRITYKIDKKTGCWEWSGSNNGNGYGRVSHNGKYICAHRGSYIVNVGPIPKGLLVLHKCDNRMCVNPDHLFLGTHKDNCHDMYKKGRQAFRKGEKNGMSKLKERDIIDIRKMRGNNDNTYTYKDIATIYNVSDRCIRAVIHNETWKHV